MIKPTLASYDLDKEFYELTFGDPQYEVMVLRAWAEEALRRATRMDDEEQTTTLDRYLELEPRDRERIDLMPPKDILRELTPQSRRFRGPPGGGFGGNRNGPGRVVRLLHRIRYNGRHESCIHPDDGFARRHSSRRASRAGDHPA